LLKFGERRIGEHIGLNDVLLLFSDE